MVGFTTMKYPDGSVKRIGGVMDSKVVRRVMGNGTPSIQKGKGADSVSKGRVITNFEPGLGGAENIGLLKGIERIMDKHFGSAQDGYIERTTPEEREADEDLSNTGGAGGKSHPITVAKGSGEVDSKVVDETLKALRTCLTRAVASVKRKPVTVNGIRAKDAAIRNEAHWQGVTDEILANQPNASSDPGMAAYLAGR